MVARAFEFGAWFAGDRSFGVFGGRSPFDFAAGRFDAVRIDGSFEDSGGFARVAGVDRRDVRDGDRSFPFEDVDLTRPFDARDVDLVRFGVDRHRLRVFEAGVGAFGEAERGDRLAEVRVLRDLERHGQSLLPRIALDGEDVVVAAVDGRVRRGDVAEPDARGVDEPLFAADPDVFIAFVEFECPLPGFFVPVFAGVDVTVRVDRDVLPPAVRTGRDCGNVIWVLVNGSHLPTPFTLLM